MTISGKAKLAGVIGWPVAHSRSPLMHNHWISTLGLEAAYVPLAVKPENLEAVLRALPLMGFVGANVTVPHKERTCELCDELDATAQRIGAVNTVVVKEDGSLEGRNTDVAGFIESLRSEACNTGNSGATAVVLGAGGAARAVTAALIDLKFSRIRIANRSLPRAEQMAAAFASDTKVKFEPVAWDARNDALDGASLLVNATSLGMRGQPNLEMDLSPLSQGSVVTDIIYSPLETPLILAARELGLTAFGGLRMLVEQARAAFAAWFGQTPPVTEALMEMLESDIKAKNN